MSIWEGLLRFEIESSYGNLLWDVSPYTQGKTDGIPENVSSRQAR